MRLIHYSLWLVLLACTGCGQGETAAPVVKQSTGAPAEKPASSTGETTTSNPAGKAETTTASTGWASIKGKFLLVGPIPEVATLLCNKGIDCCKLRMIDESMVVSKAGELANVFVYVTSKVDKIHPDYDAVAKQPLVLDNNKCVFKPHAAIWWSKQTLQLKNSDDVGHNTNYSSLTHGFNISLSPNATVEKTVDTAKLDKVDKVPYEVGCNIHPWMKARILVRDNPYGAVSAADGSFEIKNIPTGEVEFLIYHEKAGYVKEVAFAGGKTDAKGKFTLNLASNQDLGTIRVPVAIFN